MRAPPVGVRLRAMGKPLLFVAAVAVGAFGCRRGEGVGIAPEQREEQVVPSGPVDTAFAEKIHAVAIGYFDYPKVDDRPHWAPGPCAPPSAFEDQPNIRMSSAGKASLHDQKLYYLFVKDHENYLKPDAGASVFVGQVIVKQGYLAWEITKPEANDRKSRDVVEKDGRLYRTGQPLALFIMMKLDENTPNTDRGWIYGIADFNGEVKAAGVLERCASCHRNAPHDRLFGPITH
jgi:hypothetical protein